MFNLLVTSSLTFIHSRSEIIFSKFFAKFDLLCLVVPEECGVDYSSRVQCLSDDVTEEQCTAHSCCYDIRYTPHCYQGNPPGMRYFHLCKPTYYPTQLITIFFHLIIKHKKTKKQVHKYFEDKDDICDVYAQEESNLNTSEGVSRRTFSKTCLEVKAIFICSHQIYISFFLHISYKVSKANWEL